MYTLSLFLSLSLSLSISLSISLSQLIFISKGQTNSVSSLSLSRTDHNRLVPLWCPCIARAHTDITRQACVRIKYYTTLWRASHGKSGTCTCYSLARLQWRRSLKRRLLCSNVFEVPAWRVYYYCVIINLLKTLIISKGRSS